MICLLQIGAAIGAGVLVGLSTGDPRLGLATCLGIWAVMPNQKIGS